MKKYWIFGIVFTLTLCAIIWYQNWPAAKQNKPDPVLPSSVEWKMPDEKDVQLQEALFASYKINKKDFFASECERLGFVKQSCGYWRLEPYYEGKRNFYIMLRCDPNDHVGTCVLTTATEVVKKNNTHNRYMVTATKDKIYGQQVVFTCGNNYVQIDISMNAGTSLEKIRETARRFCKFKLEGTSDDDQLSMTVRCEGLNERDTILRLSCFLVAACNKLED
jgi:hypothetical protein